MTMIADELEARFESMGLPRGSYVLKPLDRLRRVIAARMTESTQSVPHFPLTMDIVLDALVAARKQANDAGTSRISINDLIIKATAMALMDVPEVNASYFPEGMLFHKHADIAVAVAVKGGLITPIVRSADSKPVAAISEEMRDLADRAQRFRLQPDEYSGGTFTISNLGMYGVSSFGSIINTPQAAILSIGALRKRPVLREGALAEESFMSVTLTCDHRAIDGATGARWLAAFKSFLEAPDWI